MGVLLCFLLSQDAEAWIEALRDASVERRDAAVRELERLGPRALPALHLALGHASEEGRDRILHVLAGVEFRGLVPPYVLASCRPVLVRVLAGDRAQALAELLNELRSRPVLERFLDDPDPDVRRVAEHAPLLAPAPDDADRLVALLRSADSGHRKLCPVCARIWGFRDVLRDFARSRETDVLALIDSEDPYVSGLAAALAADWKSKAAIPALARKAASARLDDRVDAAGALAELRCDEAADALEALARDEDLEIRFLAALGLWRIGRSDASDARACARIAMRAVYETWTPWRDEAQRLLLETGSAEDVAAALLWRASPGEEARRAAARVGFDAVLRVALERAGRGRDTADNEIENLVRSLGGPELEIHLTSLAPRTDNERRLLRIGLTKIGVHLRGAELEAACRRVASSELTPAAVAYLLDRNWYEAEPRIAEAFRAKPSGELAWAWSRLSRGAAVPEILKAIEAGLCPAEGEAQAALRFARDAETVRAIFESESLREHRVSLATSMEHPAALPVLRELRDQFLEGSALGELMWALALWGDRESASWIREHRSSKPDAAIQALGRLHDRASAPDFLSLARNGDPLAPAAIQALTDMRDPAVLPLLRQRLLSSEARDRWSAVFRLGEARDPAAADDLEDLFRFVPDSDILRALARIDASRARRLAIESAKLWAVVTCLTREDLDRLGPALEDPESAGWASRAVALVVHPVRRPEREIRFDVRGLDAAMKRLSDAFEVPIVWSREAERLGHRFQYQGWYTFAEALNQLPPQLGWIPDGAGVRIVSREEALAHWRGWWMARK